MVNIPSCSITNTDFRLNSSSDYRLLLKQDKWKIYALLSSFMHHLNVMDPVANVVCFQETCSLPGSFHSLLPIHFIGAAVPGEDFLCLPASCP